MSSEYTKYGAIFLADLFKSSIANNNMYLCISRINPWANDLDPDQANTSINSLNEFWKNMIGGIKITGNDIAFSTPRIDWTQNTVYKAYSSNSSTLFDAANNKFYVMTPEYNVYKCLHNNYGGNSTVKPVSTNPNTVIQTSDGYYWKFLYTLSSSDRLKFLTDDYMPVKNLLLNDGSIQWRVQQAAIPGSINIITVVNGGNNYTNTSNLIVTISGDGENAAAFANINSVSNSVSSVTVTSYGSGYNYAKVFISGGGGDGTATARAEIPPPGGHGSDLIRELGASNIMINIKLKGSEGGKLTTVNDFRQIGILLNPSAYNSSNLYSNTVFSQTLDLILSGTGTDYKADEIVYQGASLSSATFSGKIVEFDTGNSTAKITDVVGVPSSDILYGAETLTSRYITFVKYPDLKLYSGQILYINNMEPIIRDPSQYENFNILLSF